MRRQRNNAEKRAGFTLIELLIVILIIGILVGMMLAAVGKITEKVSEVKARTEISEMNVALRAFMSDYQLKDPPPSLLYLREDGQYITGGNMADQKTVQFLQMCFGRNFNVFMPRDWNGNGTIDPPYVLQGQQSLVFYLGGIPVFDALGNLKGMSGFSRDNMLPNASATVNSNRKGPYFSFDNNRLSLQGSFPVYMDAYQVKNANQPYAFFSAQGNFAGYNQSQFLTNGTLLNPQGDCSLVGAFCYYEAINPTTGAPQYTSVNTYQILSAGKDGVFGFDTMPAVAGGVKWSAYGGLAGTGLNHSGQPAGNDDQANFSATKLGVGQN